ncbi:low molecular weight protein-tyrosine-phosphatase [Parachlamydia sp. AcF125]|uniref:low molecular weight protein-tyrosine-phosphatase n=1 Tax=Parachlamydia sp. AcF125 TaxID=2795736 RepID=UPI001BC9E256|nr:low molecular weight protein-tyrosine-phosphatase [Parachlamydia sp. AcF125]MBS4168566.1 Low molecular weight protein-tyrosine-phosphatase YfkJ [Parachlamydia sp. AcF125]
MISVLFVCLGNICRSPAAEGVLRHLVNKQGRSDLFHIQSCGIGDWHVGHLPDERMRDSAKNRGVVLASRAQIFKYEFFDQFDYIFAADHEILNLLYQHAASSEQKTKIHLMTVYSPCYPNEEIVDPFYQGRGDFERVLDILEDACEGFLNYLTKQNKI